MEESQNLKVGDYIHLNYVKLNGYLSAEGVLDDELYCDRNVLNFDEVLFQVQLQRQYSAAYELNLFNERQLEIVAERGTLQQEDKRTAQYREALTKGRDNEIAMNESFMRERIGTPVLFGDVVQLLHVKSQKYVSLLPGELARDERENMTAFLSSEGSAESWFQVLPRFKIDREGDKVPPVTEFYLKLAERANEYLHCADKNPPPGLKREVNIALGMPTSWRMQIFRSSVDVMSGTNVMCGMPITLLDPESNTYLAVQSPSLRLNVTTEVDISMVMDGNDGRVASRRASVGEVSINPISVASQDDMGEFLDQHGDVVLKEARKGANQDSMGVWVVESSELIKGGVIKWKTDLVRLRHYRTGKYLAIGGTGHSVRVFTTVDANQRETLLNLTNISNNSNHLLQKNCPIMLHKGKGYIQRKGFDERVKLYTTRGTHLTSHAVNLIVNEYTETPDGSMPRINGLLQPLDLAAARTIRYFLEYYQQRLSIPDQGLLLPGCDNILPREDVLKLSRLIETLQTVVLYITGEALTVAEAGPGVDHDDHDLQGVDLLAQQHTKRHRQDLLREQGVLDILLKILNELVPVSLAREQAALQGISVNTQAYATAEQVLSNMLTLTLHLVDGNSTNQLAVADHLLIILGHVTMDRKASSIVQSMLADNDEVQETRIGIDEINIFAARMHDREMNVVYMRMLTSCCSCNNMPVVSNQKIVEDVIFGANASLLISLDVDDGHRVQNTFRDGDSIYTKSLSAGFASDAHSVAGLHIFERGAPIIRLTWKAFSEESMYHPKRLYGMDPVAANLVMRQKGSMGSETRAHANARSNVSEFFKAQLMLSSEMCLGRNYPVMEKLETVYSFDKMLSLYLVSTDDDTRHYIVTLIQALHVDRDPQSISHLPRLTRTIKTVGEDRRHGVASPRLPSVEEERLQKFALLQHIFSTEFNAYKGLPYRRYSCALAKVMHKLLLFDFYGTNERMTDLITTLVQTLDRRGVDVRVANKVEAISRKMSKRGSVSKVKSSGKLVRKQTDDGLDAHGDIDDEEEDETIYKRILTTLEGTNCTLFMMGLVVVSLAVAGYQIGFIRDKDEDSNKDPDAELRDTLFWVDVGIFILFCAEFTMRLLCFVVVKENFVSFWSDAFNWLDFIVIFIDALLLAMAGLLADAADAGSFSKGLRLLRIAKVVRMFRLVKNMVNRGVRLLSKWKAPLRYAGSHEEDLATMNELAAAVRSTQRVIDDRNLSMLLSAFHEWCGSLVDDSSDASQSLGRKTPLGLGGKASVGTYVDMSPAEIFMSMHDHFSDMCVSSPVNDEIYLDIIMYDNHELVQTTLDILMQHHQANANLLENLKQVQLLVSNKDETSFRRVQKLIEDVSNAIDAFPMWSHLTSEKEEKVLSELVKNMDILTDLCRNQRQVLVLSEEFEPNQLMQDMLRNCGCFDVTMKALRLVDIVSRIGYTDDARRRLLSMLCSTSQLLFWFALSNPSNQDLCFGELDFFLQHIDDKIDVHVMLEATFKDNDTLMKLCPKSYIGDMVQKILINGRFPEYLILLSNVTCAGEKNILEKQFEVILNLASPENVKQVLQFFCPVSHPDYAKKSKAMAPLVNKRILTETDLPRDLAYHMELIKVMTGCTVGRINITSVEAKVQSLWHFVDVVNAILDNNSPLLLRTRIGYFFFHAMVDVEMRLPSLSYAQCVWDYLGTMGEVFGAAKDMLRQIEKNGWSAPTSNRQLIEYTVVCVMVVMGYFEIYYDSSIFTLDAAANAGERKGGEKVKMRQNEGEELIRSLFDRIQGLFELQSPLLSTEHKDYMYRALLALNKCARSPIVSKVENVEAENAEAAEELQLSSHSRDSRNLISNKFREFVSGIDENEDVLEMLSQENDHLIEKIENTPRISHASDSDVRYEPLMRKLVTHSAQCIRTTEIDGILFRVMEDNSTATTTWLLRMFRTMIERKWGMTIDERDDDGGEEQDEAAAEVMQVLNECGATVLCLDLISPGIDRDLRVEAMKLCVALLFKEGGALAVQETMFAHLNRGGTDYFFRQVREMITELIEFHKWGGVVILEEGEEPDLPDEIILIRFLQLMCEGHYLPNQDIMREQKNNANSYNLLDDFVFYFHALDAIPCATSTEAALAVSATILEVIQGPCEGNQDHLGLNTELIESMNRKMRSRRRNDCDEEQELELKKNCVEIFQGLLEGQGRKVAVFERVLSVIHIDIVELLASPPPPIMIGKREVAPEQSEIEIELETEALVLVKMLLAFKPSLAKELMTENAKSDVAGGSSASVEVVWRGELQRRFFHVPDLCGFIAKRTKDTFVEQVERDSQESKLLGLLGVCRQIYREVKHQEFLDETGLAALANSDTIDFVSSWAFLVALTMNVLMLSFYTSTKDYSAKDQKILEEIAWAVDDDANDQGFEKGYPAIDDIPDDDTMPGPWEPWRPFMVFAEVQDAIDALVWVYIAAIACVIVLSLIVRAPVRLKQFVEEGTSEWVAVILAALDPQIMYYILFLGLAVLGQELTPGFYTFLLLDIISKNATCQDVLKAVTYPYKQLIIAAMMMFTVIYTTSFFVFRYFSNADHLFDPEFCETVWNCFKDHLFIGIGGDLGDDHSSLNIGDRYVLDLTYFLAQFVMLNIVGGIMIDTFSELRTLMMERVHETENFCFVCGIENLTFDRGIGRGAFKHHIARCHNMWDYVNFILFIWEQDKDDDDGMEQYVRRCIDANDISWLPINKSIDLVVDEEVSEADVLKQQWDKELQTFERATQKLAHTLQSEFVVTAATIQEKLETRKSDAAAAALAASLPGLEHATADGSRIVEGEGAMVPALMDGLRGTNEVRIQPLCVHNVLRDGDDPTSFKLRFLGDKVVDVQGQAVKGATRGSATSLFFAPTIVPVHTGLDIDLTPSEDGVSYVRIQLVQDLGFRGLDKLIGVTDIPIGALVEASGLHMEHDFFLARDKRDVKMGFFTASSESIKNLRYL